MSDAEVTASANVILFGERLFIATMSRSQQGVWFSPLPELETTLAASDAEIGKLASRALSLSVRGLPHPSNEEFALLDKRFNRLVGVRGWRALHFASEHVLIEVANGITVAARMTKRRDGAFYRPYGQVSRTNPGEVELGAMIRAALALEPRVE